MKNILSIVALTLILSSFTDAQARADADYYLMWPGKWFRVENGKVSKQPKFVVEQGLNARSFEEIWISDGYVAKAWRGWNSRKKRWDFAWVTDDGLFQIWEGRKVNGVWYMYNTFVVNGEPVISRQAFILENDNTLVRTSEHSRDEGKTWRLRFRENYVKGK